MELGFIKILLRLHECLNAEIQKESVQKNETMAIQFQVMDVQVIVSQLNLVGFVREAALRLKILEHSDHQDIIRIVLLLQQVELLYVVIRRELEQKYVTMEIQYQAMVVKVIDFRLLLDMLDQGDLLQLLIHVFNEVLGFIRIQLNPLESHNEVMEKE